MRNRFDNQLEKLNNELIEMGSMIEQAIEKAISALVNNDVELAKTVIEGDEDIDHQERRVESLCEIVITAATCCQGFSPYFVCPQNDHRYGTYWRSCGRYFRNDRLDTW